MAIWTVWEHERHGEEERPERAVFVRDGFAWLAFLFPPLWLLANGMIVVFLVTLVAVGAILFAVNETLGEPFAMLASFVLALLFGFEARALRRWSLARRGWTMTGVVEAKDFRRAERRYYAARLEERAAPPLGPVTPPGSAPPPLPPGYGGTPPGPAPWGAPSSPVLGVFPEGTR